MSDTLLPTTLCLFSAVTLAIANVAVKRGGDILASRSLMSVTAAIVMLPFAFFVPLPDAATWGALALSVPAHFFYQSCLVRSLHRGDLSLVFPVMRGLGPLLAGFAAWLVLGESLAPLAVVGLVLATLAVASFAWPGKGTRLTRHPDRAALVWAAGTALGIALYSISDARGVRVAPEPLTFIVWLFLLEWVVMTSVSLAMRRRELIETFRSQWRFGALAGLLSVLSFGSYLYALGLTEVARAAALRETAVVFAALLGWRFLNEPFGARRTIAACLLAFGLALLQLTN